MTAKGIWITAWSVVGLLVLGGGLIFGKVFMDKGATEQPLSDRSAMELAYQDGMRQVQETFTEYLLENYEGVAAVEWEGVEVEWRDSPVFGPSLLGNGVASDFKVYVNDTDYFTSYYWLNDKMEYDHDLERYVPTGTLSPKNMDMRIEDGISGLREETGSAFDEFRKSATGSPGARVVYDLEIHEPRY
ncbi:hypothetical protein G7067_12550 [Leucobacter insecticola]|uniref:Uncharacterized protein n=1 Tax=Leucobacter insecticola TaxID=2714934 RepID=A0A6G8FL01_9MICO|nr:hypothetical protein [Leucobacter insecticola]QIM17047.1 hypothetical protein G7067_12550 [Leucobacter insecticola]